MSKATSAKKRIESQIIDALGTTVTKYVYVSGSIDKWGDSTNVYGGTGGLVMPIVMPVTFTAGASESIKCVPYSYVFKKTSFQAFGDVQDGDVIVVFKDGEEPQVKDKIEYLSKTYYVRQVENFPLQDINLVKVVRLVESL